MLELVTPPAIEPVSVAEVRSHLRLDQTEDDTWLAGRITSARIAAETITRRALITTNYVLWLDHFYDWKKWSLNRYVLPALRRDEIEIRICPVQSAGTIRYTGSDGSPLLHSLTAGIHYQTDLVSEPARIRPLPGQAWPQVAADTVNTVKIDLFVGYGDTADTVPQPFKDYIVSRVAFQYEHRGDDAAKEPEYLAALLDDYRWTLHA